MLDSFKGPRRVAKIELSELEHRAHNLLASGAQTQLICYNVHTLWYSVKDIKEDKVPKYTVPQALHHNFDYLISHRSVTHTHAVDSDT